MSDFSMKPKGAVEAAKEVDTFARSKDGDYDELSGDAKSAADAEVKMVQKWVQMRMEGGAIVKTKAQLKAMITDLVRQFFRLNPPKRRRR